MKRIKQVLFAQTTCVTIIILCLFFTQSVFSFDALRPLSSQLQAQNPVAGTQSMFSSKSSAAATATYTGISNAVSATAIGKAALFSSYSAYDILRNIKYAMIATERDDVLPRAMAQIRQLLREADTQDTEKTMLVFNGYEEKSRNYFTNRLRSKPDNGRLIRNSIGTLEFFLSIDIRKAHAGNDRGQEAMLKQILRCVQQRALDDINEQETITPEDAREQWDAFVQVRDELLKDYSSQLGVSSKQDRELGEKIEALTMRNEKLTHNLSVAEHEHDTRESEAIKDVIEENKFLISQCANAQSDLKDEHSAYMIDQLILENISDTTIKGPENILQQNRTVMQLLYGAHREQEEAALDFDRSIEDSDKTYRVFTYGMRRVESIMVRLKNVPAFYLKTAYDDKDLVLLSNNEPSVEALKDLVEVQQKRIKAIVCLEGAIASHWVIVAQGMGIPVVLLGASTRSAEEIASLEDNIIVETTLGEREGTVIVRPDTETLNMSGLFSLRQEFYADLCLQQYMVGKQGKNTAYLSVYANTSSPENVAKAGNIGIEGIGIYRTELAPSKKTQLALKSYLSDPDNQKERVLLDAFIVDMYLSLREYRNSTGPFVLRTDDFEEDKNVANIVKLLGERGFDIYRTDAGNKVVSLRIASYYIALLTLQQKGGYDFTPGMIFPMVKTQRDVHFMRDEITPQALDIVSEYLDVKPNDITLQLDTGPMIETAEACDNIDSIMVDPKTRLISVGNSDLTASVLSRDFAIDIKRGDKHFGQFFFSLKPSVCKKYEEIIEAVSIWNDKYPDNVKRIGFCGAQATLDEFVLLASFLAKKYDNVPIYISVPSGIVPLISFFLLHIEDKDLDVFEQGIGFKTQQLASDKAREIHERIRKSKKYKEHVDARLESIQRLGIKRVEHDSCQTVQPRYYRRDIESAINSAA